MYYGIKQEDKQSKSGALYLLPITPITISLLSLLYGHLQTMSVMINDEKGRCQVLVTVCVRTQTNYTDPHLY
jgi:hypothetical protein